MNNSANQEVRSSDEQATAQRAHLLNLPYIDSRGWSDQVELIKGVLGLQEMYSLHAIPVSVDSGQMRFVITTNTAQQVMGNLKDRFADYNLSFSLISESGFKELMLRHDPPATVNYDDITIAGEGQSTTIESVSRTLEQVKSDDVLTYLIKQAQRLYASDIHFENEKDYVRMRFRVDGALHAIAQLSKDKYRQLSSSIAVKADVSVSAEQPQTGRMSYDYTKQDGTQHTLNMRVETAPTAHGQDVVVRLFNIDQAVMKLDTIGFSKEHRLEIEDIIRHPHGMVLVVGPTGSGKTTTLYSILDKLNTPTRKIVTLEDPVEYNFEGVTQIPIKTRQGDKAFAENLRAVLRLDPDVIMVGEIRDVDTAKTALQAALTGHLVLSTFHSQDAASALTRMLDIIGENPLFSSAIRLVIGQRLVRRLDDNSKQSYKPDDRLKSEVEQVLATLPEGVNRPNTDDMHLWKPVKSENSPFGYSGRMMLYEQLKQTPQIQAMLRKGPNKVATEDIQQLALSQGMATMLHDGVLKALAGLTSIEEVYRTL